MAKKAPVAPKAKAHTAKKVYEPESSLQLPNLMKVRNANGVTFIVNREYYEKYTSTLTIVNDA
jgi:hypothetical protein